MHEVHNKNHFDHGVLDVASHTDQISRDVYGLLRFIIATKANLKHIKLPKINFNLINLYSRL